MADYHPEDAQKYPSFGLFFRRYAPFETFARADQPINLGGSSEGDHRADASTSLKATSRTYGCVMFNREGIFYNFAGSSGTVTHTLLWGDIVGMADVGINVIPLSSGSNLVAFIASTAGGYRLLPGSPDIDTMVRAQIDFTDPKWMRIAGEAFGDNFPNLEVFVRCFRSSHSALLIDGRTTGGRDTGPFTRLIGTHSDYSLGKFVANLGLSNEGQLLADRTVAATSMGDYPSPPPPPTRTFYGR